MMLGARCYYTAVAAVEEDSLLGSRGTAEKVEVDMIDEIERSRVM